MLRQGQECAHRDWRRRSVPLFGGRMFGDQIGRVAGYRAAFPIGQPHHEAGIRARPYGVDDRKPLAR